MALSALYDESDLAVLPHSPYLKQRFSFASWRSIYDIKNYSAEWGFQLFLHIPEVISNIPDFLSLGDIIAHLG